MFLLHLALMSLSDSVTLTRSAQLGGQSWRQTRMACILETASPFKVGSRACSLAALERARAAFAPFATAFAAQFLHLSELALLELAISACAISANMLWIFQTQST